MSCPGHIWALEENQTTFQETGCEIGCASLLSGGGTWVEHSKVEGGGGGIELIPDLMEKSSIAQGDQSNVAF